MAAKSKKRLVKNQNNLLKFEKLELKDVFCSICHSVLIEPVTLPCFHNFCENCFNGSIENNALCCPLCRLRIGSWLRTARKQKNLVNNELWHLIKSKFSHVVEKKIKGEDIVLTQDVPLPRLSAPGEIRLEYECELKRLRTEEALEFHKTEILIRKIQEEEEEANRRYLETIKQDELLALKLEKEQLINSEPAKTKVQENKKARLKNSRIECFLSKTSNEHYKSHNSNTTTICIPPKISVENSNGNYSPEIVPSFGKSMKNVIDINVKHITDFSNKENGEKVNDQKNMSENNIKSNNIGDDENPNTKNAVQSLLVSLPLSCTGVLQNKTSIVENMNPETDSVDSMHQELCYFKPIKSTTPVRGKTQPLRVPGRRVLNEKPQSCCVEPTRAQYLDKLCHLRSLSIAKNVPSAFVIALNILKVTKEETLTCVNTRSKVKKAEFSSTTRTLPRKTATNKQKQISARTNLRRTRSMSNIIKEENETTPRKVKHDRKTCSEHKRYLRSDTKKSNTKKGLDSPPLVLEVINNNKVNLAVKNLSSPLKKCDVTKILQEQLRIEKVIEQEKCDYELARKLEAEWNNRRQPRREAIKRQMTLNYALRPAKKLKV